MNILDMNIVVHMNEHLSSYENLSSYEHHGSYILIHMKITKNTRYEHLR